MCICEDCLFSESYANHLNRINFWWFNFGQFPPLCPVCGGTNWHYAPECLPIKKGGDKGHAPGNLTREQKLDALNREDEFAPWKPYDTEEHIDPAEQARIDLLIDALSFGPADPETFIELRRIEHLRHAEPMSLEQLRSSCRLIFIGRDPTTTFEAAELFDAKHLWKPLARIAQFAFKQDNEFGVDMFKYMLSGDMVDHKDAPTDLVRLSALFVGAWLGTAIVRAREEGKGFGAFLLGTLGDEWVRRGFGCWSEIEAKRRDEASGAGASDTTPLGLNLRQIVVTRRDEAEVRAGVAVAPHFSSSSQRSSVIASDVAVYGLLLRDLQRLSLGDTHDLVLEERRTLDLTAHKAALAAIGGAMAVDVVGKEWLAVRAATQGPRKKKLLERRMAPLKSKMKEMVRVAAAAYATAAAA